MTQPLNRTLRTRLYAFVTKRVVYHSLFWIGLLILLMAIDQTQTSFLSTVTIELINLAFYAGVVYFNLFYLIPKYLGNKKFIRYSLFLFLSALAITPIKMMVLYVLFDGQGDAQAQLIDDQPMYFLSSFLIAGSSTVLKVFSDWVRYQRDHQLLQTQNMQSELRFLRSQINPHFLFNTLNSLYALTLKKSDKAPEIVIKLSEMMRYMLYECNEKRVPLSKEINYIENYLELEKLRHGEKMNINFELSGLVEGQKIAPLMFIPFLENSFKHGLKNQIDPGFVNIKMDVNTNEVRVKIENSKSQKLPAQIHKRSGGIGLKNVRRRLHILYPNKHQLNINDNPKSYEVNLQIGLDS